MSSQERIRLIADEGKIAEFDTDLPYPNPLYDEEYHQKLVQTFNECQISDAIVTGVISINGLSVAAGIMDARFMMASMGYVVGEKITRLFERAIDRKLNVVIFCCSGGARMQEGAISLMQMGKTAAAVKKHSDAGLLYVPVLTDPTMGGVTASFAMLGDICIAEPEAMIGFAGARVIEQTIGTKLPEDFQSSEFQMQHGYVDRIVERHKIKDCLYKILRLHQKSETYPKLPVDSKYCLKNSNIRSNGQEFSAWEKVKIARMRERPTTIDYIDCLFNNFIELHGDRYSGDDKAIISGLATFCGIPVTVIGQQRGKKTAEEAVYRNFGMPSPEGYRKSLRLMHQAEKFQRPIICFIDTLGAYCGKEAEEHGQGEAIARNLYEMSTFTVPILSIVIGEGGSGGALALALANEVWMLENAVLSVISPEGYASILWKDSTRACEASEKLKLTAKELLDINIIDKIITEPEPLTLSNMEETCRQIKAEMILFLNRFCDHSRQDIMTARDARFRKF